jgi:hypothetical protein
VAGAAAAALHVREIAHERAQARINDAVRSVEGTSMSRLTRAALGGLLAAALAGPPAFAAPSSECAKAQRKVTKEERWTVSAEATIERDRKGRATCATAQVCERYDERIRTMETRKMRHDARLARFRGEAAKACGSG